MKKQDILKRILLFIVLLVTSIGYAIACDFHGSFIGLNSYYNRNLISLRCNSYSILRSGENAHLHANGHSHLHSDKDNFVTTELSSRFYLHDKFQVVTLLPFIVNNSQRTLGDFNLIGQFQIYDRLNDTLSGTGVRLFGGVGIKAPSGKFKYSDKDRILNTGSGSWDYSLNSTLLFKRDDFSLGTDFAYQMSTKNNLSYKYSNRISINSNLYYNFSVKDLVFLPFLGISSEFSGKDTFKEQLLEHTERNNLLINTGMEHYYQHFAFNILIQKSFLPIVIDPSISYMDLKISLGFNYLF